jgi:SAM-dependent methyltransferase
LIADLWRIGQGTDVSGLFRGVERFEIYESPTGLIYFDPPITGDGAFYESYYRRWQVHKGLTHLSGERMDFRHAAAHVPEGAHVIDVGSGPGMFRHHLGHARYTGLDPYAEADGDAVIVRETLAEHAASHAGRYDVASAFHVIEHVPDPLAHAADMARLLKPGGLLILAAPLYPSPLSEIPNLPLNMPPHHVTWWNPSAFKALAETLGLETVEASVLPASPHQGLIYWMHRLLAQRTDPPPQERFYAHRWSWHASLAAAYLMARVAVAFRRLPPNPRPVDAFLVARKKKAA